MAARTTNRSHSNNSNDDDNPFCLLCSHNNTSVRIHHPWCSKNPQRDTGKVDELLNRIKHGVKKLQCNACQTEYQTGKQVITNNTSKKINNNANDGTTMVRHNQACLIYQKQLRNVRRQREKEEEEEGEELEEEPKKARTMKKKRRVSTTATVTSSQSRKSNEEEDDDDDEDDRSVFEPATKKTRRMQALTFSRKSYNKQTVAAATANDNDSSNDNHDSRVKPRWVPLSDDEQDPWGEEGWQIEDSLLYGPQRGTGHLVSNNRYAMNPFEIGSNYHRTHGTPEKGLSILGLTRDPLGKFPWGFVVTRHELGWACIVETVHQNTPASAATFVGVPSNDKDFSPSASLNINDMIMMINGKIVGGMSEVEFNLELEMNSPNLILGISKYKHVETVERNFTILEQQLLHHQDSVARDNRMIGWQEIGTGSVPTAPVRTPLLAERRIEDVSLTTQDEFGSDDAVDNDDEAIATNTDPDDEVADMTSQQQSKASCTLSSNVAVDDDAADISSDNDSDESVATATSPDFVPPQSSKQVAQKSKRSRAISALAPHCGEGKHWAVLRDDNNHDDGDNHDCTIRKRSKRLRSGKVAFSSKQVAQGSKRSRAISALASYCGESKHWAVLRDDNNHDDGDNHDCTIRKRSKRLRSGKVAFYCYCGRNVANEYGLKIDQANNRCTTLASASAAAGKVKAKNGSEDDDNNNDISSNTRVFNCTCGRTFDDELGLKIEQFFSSASAAARKVKASNECENDDNSISSNRCVFDCVCGRTFDNEKGFKIHQTRMRCTTLAPSKSAPTIYTAARKVKASNECENDDNSISSNRCVFDCVCGRTFDNEKGFKIHQTRMRCTTLAPSKSAPTINNESEDNGNSHSKKQAASSKKKAKNSKKKKNTNNPDDAFKSEEYRFFYCPTLILVSGGRTYKQVLGSYALE